MAKRKAKKKSPSSSSRPSPSFATCPMASGPSSPTKKHARHRSLPPLSRVVDLATLEGANWMLDLDSDPLPSGLDSSGAALTAAGSVTSYLALVASGATPSQQLSPQLQAIEFSPTLSEMLAPVNMDSPRDSDYDGSPSSNSDSSSHYGSSVLAMSELSPASSAPAVVEGPSNLPAASMESGPVMQVGLVSAKGHPPSDQAAAHAGKDVLVSDGAASLATGMVFEALAPAGDLTRQSAPKKPSSNKPLAPVISEAATADCEWQLVPKKLTTNRQPKSGLDIAADWVQSSVRVASKGKPVMTADNVSVENDLMASGAF
ncbi:hypothetical protein OIU77_006157 [Salix suchowensis]|uniref:Uncharacterized protein n=1 Tax=Salix suchowensis TaxID=1278906 RepID=A0ABQ9ATC5_9ROSI|nr:hypothetical protein OIU77_006157 [Salix suchowensis]